MSRLFSPFTLRGTTFRNRAWVSPMCQYSSHEGHPTDWHLVHYGALARGGAGLVMTEATAVSADGRISPADAGVWTDAQASDLRRIVDQVHAHAAAAGIQLAHAGRKASTSVPWLGRGYVGAQDGGWQTVGPSPLPFDGWPAPRELSIGELGNVVGAFADAAQRAATAGFDVVEVHAAHGYLLHQFLSPLSNTRTDAYGGSLENRARLLLQVATAVREQWPAHCPVFVRLSATDWVDGGWALSDTIGVSRHLAKIGVDLVDVSSAGLDPRQRIPTEPGFQVPFAAAVRTQAQVATAAVGLITEPEQAERVLRDEAADAVMLGRVMLRNPHWPLLAAARLGAEAAWPVQYERARPS